MKMIFLFFQKFLKEKLYSYKSDIWSLGILIYYILFKKFPYNGTEYNIIKEMNQIKN